MPAKQASVVGSVANLDAEPEAAEFNPDDFPSPPDQHGSSGSLRSSITGLGVKKSVDVGKVVVQKSIPKVVVRTSTDGPRRLSRNRASIVQVVDMYTAAAQRRNRRISSHLPDAARNLILEDLYPLMFPTIGTKCKILQKKLVTDRIFLVSKSHASQEELLVFVTQQENALTAFPALVTGYCMIYSGFVISVFEGAAAKLQKVLKLLDGPGSVLTNTRILYENFDIPERITTAVRIYTMPNLTDQPPKPDVMDIPLLVKLVIGKVIQFGLTISQFNKADEEIRSKQVIVASNRSIIYVEQFNTLLHTELLFTIPAYLVLAEGVLNLDGLGGDFQWPYGDAPTSILD